MDYSLDMTMLDIKVTDRHTDVPDNPKAKLMFYLHSVLTLVGDTSSLDGDVRKLSNYPQYKGLSDTTTETLLIRCLELSPRELVHKIIFLEPQLCPDANNVFYDVSKISNKLLVPHCILIGRHTRMVTAVMACTPAWIDEYWIQPMDVLKAWLDKRRGL